MIPTEDSEANRSFVAKVKDYLKGFGMRILVHGAALLCAGVVAGASVGSFVFLGTYLGLICLVARETSLNTKWVLPTSFGLVQTLICFGLGLPLYQAIFWGGFQAYVQRIFAKKFNLGFEWVVSILLLPVALDSLISSPNLMGILGSFLGLSFVGGVFWRVFAKRYEVKKQDKKLNEPINNKEQEVVKDSEEDTIQENAPFKDYNDSIAKLRVKQILLPKNMQQSIQALTASAEAIIICMQEDKRDTEPGKRFLNRYLPATHSVLDNYRRHCKDASTNAQVAQALNQSEEVIVRLEQAFAHEHNHLLRNNIDDFSADLRVLDTLLKMDGR